MTNESRRGQETVRVPRATARRIPAPAVAGARERPTAHPETFDRNPAGAGLPLPAMFTLDALSRGVRAGASAAAEQEDEDAVTTLYDRRGAPPSARDPVPDTIRSPSPSAEQGLVPPTSVRDITSWNRLLAFIAATAGLLAITLTGIVAREIAERRSPSRRVARAATDESTRPTRSHELTTAVALARSADEPNVSVRADRAIPLVQPATRAPASARSSPRAPHRQAVSDMERGFLTVMCVPGCDSIKTGGRDLGPSPIVRAPLPAGDHTVTLRAPGGKSRLLMVTVTPGQTVARRVAIGDAT